MNVHLTPELEALVRGKIRTGLFKSENDVVSAALRLLADHDRRRAEHHRELRSALAEGIAEADRGELLDGPEVVDRLHAFLRDSRDFRDTRE
ncbi:MAG: type II toxin-antitoxin system ParD family antitoxin [Planctomycetes bacterium]|nr:type II toxin-antitoxin system ParD family antitoxin [Planctomycetota bacterium]MCB9906021.1 type II toxin-antitoxin system ParD family antitoxin [Planctomycetota bacterium]